MFMEQAQSQLFSKNIWLCRWSSLQHITYDIIFTPHVLNHTLSYRLEDTSSVFLHELTTTFIFCSSALTLPTHLTPNETSTQCSRGLVHHATLHFNTTGDEAHEEAANKCFKFSSLLNCCSIEARNCCLQWGLSLTIKAAFSPVCSINVYVLMLCLGFILFYNQDICRSH